MRGACYLVAHCFVCAEYSLLNFDQSLAAAAGVAVARRFCRVNPVWPDELATICGYDAHELRECYETVWKMFCDNFPDCDSSVDTNASPKCVTCISFGESSSHDMAYSGREGKESLRKEPHKDARHL
jgi:hypothetical protein